jgi:hypothetical protein
VLTLANAIAAKQHRHVQGDVVEVYLVPIFAVVFMDHGDWSNGVMEWWSNGVMEWWSNGILE